MNTWTIEVDGTEGSIAFTTKRPKTLRTMRYSPGEPQRWEETDLGSQSAYPSITGAIFEFGFADALQQMWAAFLDELAHGRDGMRQPFHCVTPEEAAFTHDLFTAALRADAERSVERGGAALPAVVRSDRPTARSACSRSRNGSVSKQLPVPERPDVGRELGERRPASLAERVHRHLDDHAPVGRHGRSHECRLATPPRRS